MSYVVHHGRAEDLLPTIEADAVITDPPHETSPRSWDRWPNGWPSLVQAPQVWLFLPIRRLLEFKGEFAGWKYGQELIWEKPNGTGCQIDRFRKVHETAFQFYRGRWSDLPRQTPRVPRPHDLDKSTRRRDAGGHVGHYDPSQYVDDGTRLCRSVIRAPQPSRGGKHPTQKPPELLRLMIEYSTRPGDTPVLDPFCGSGETLFWAREMGRKAVGIEMGREFYETARKR